MKSDPTIGEHPLSLFAFLLAEMDAGHQCVLVTVVDVVGASSRAIGAHMVVSDRGVFAGYVSNGCVDADVAMQALETLNNGEARRVRYGAGSPYLDIRLPCGGSIDILMTPSPDGAVIEQAVQRLRGRQSLLMLLGDDGKCEIIKAEHQPSESNNVIISHAPPLHVQIAGRGVETIEMARLARAANYQVSVWSPDEMVIEQARLVGAAVTKLLSSSQQPEFESDPWTAIVLMFHDHEWEADILVAALKTKAFYIGAMGSRKTHTARVEELKLRGVDLQDIARIHGPIGLAPSMRDAPRLAISTLAEIIDTDRRAVR